VSPSYCLDTNILFALVRGRALGKQLDAQFGLSAASFQHTISIVTHGEMLVLGDRNGWGENKRAALSKALQEFVTVDISGQPIVNAYREVERVSARVPEGAVKMGKNDIWIAATAVVTGLALVTTDKDFRHLNNVLLDVFWIDPHAT
jgi:tRNA(fMet)-specific endonuclease VapC